MIGSDSIDLSWTRSGSMIPPTISPLRTLRALVNFR